MHHVEDSPSSEPLVSIIIPCYRQAHFLPEAIESCLAQTYPAVEIIVVNDGSDDDTESVSARYGDRIVYVHRANGGLSAARNTGIARARGAYLKFLDADDHLHPEQIARQVEAIGGRADHVCQTTVRAYQDDDPEVYQDQVSAENAILPDVFKDVAWAGIHGFLFPVELVRAVGGFDETLQCTEDGDFVGKIGLLDPVLVTDLRLGAYYRLKPGSMSTNKPQMAINKARSLIGLHDRLRDGSRRDWFGVDLLGAEQRVYFNLLMTGVRDRPLLGGLAARIRELQRVVGVACPSGGRFGRMVAFVGYPIAARARQAYYTKILRIRYS